MLAGTLPLHKMAKQMLEGGLAACDPSFLFEWPFARILAVFFMDSVRGGSEARDISTPAAWLAWANERRAKKGLPPLTELPKRGASDGR